MYDLAEVVPGRAVEPGTNLLVAGPPLTGKRRLALQLIAAGHERDEGALVVTTRDSARRILEEYGEMVPDLAEADLGIVDCVTRQQGGGDQLDDERVAYTASPVDMTGIGIELSELLERFYVERGLQRNRILLDSVSTLLMYSDLRTVFRFLHVFTGRVASADAFGIYVVDASAHDDRTLSTLEQLFDGVLVVEEAPDGGEPRTELQGL